MVRILTIVCAAPPRCDIVKPYPPGRPRLSGDSQGYPPSVACAVNERSRIGMWATRLGAPARGHWWCGDVLALVHDVAEEVVVRRAHDAHSAQGARSHFCAGKVDGSVDFRGLSGVASDEDELAFRARPFD